MSLEILSNSNAKSKLTRGFETCQESGEKVVTRLERERAHSVPENTGRSGLYKTTKYGRWQVL